MYDFDLYQNMLTVIILIISYVLVFIIGCKKFQDIKIVSFIFIWHTLFSFIYYYYTLFNTADAVGYYLMSLADNEFEFYPGSRFVIYITNLLSQYIDLNYFNATLFFNMLGALGLVLFYQAIKILIKEMIWYWVFILFIPSMSFWSAGLGKDSISFFATCLFLYAVTTSKKTIPLVLIALFAMFMVRPHIGAQIIASYSIYFILRAKVHILFKFITIPIIITGLLLSINFVEQYIGLDESSADSYTDYISGRENANRGGGSSLDISSMSYPMKMFTYVFRPLPFEAHNITALVSSIENTILLLLFLYIILKSKFNYRTFIQDKNLWLSTYVFLTCSVLALTTANLGIATRQKWMFMPVLIYLLIHSFYIHKIKISKVYQ